MSSLADGPTTRPEVTQDAVPPTGADEPGLIVAAGGVVRRRGRDGGVEVALVHRPKYDDWSLPKGKLDPGEHALEAAVREVGEETGLVVLAGRRGLRTRYRVPKGPKRVDYWLMEAVGGGFSPNDEVDELRWLGFDAAADLVTHAHDRGVLEDAGRGDLPAAPRVLLVRHGSAGDKRTWDGDDDLRPLDRTGRDQARRLAEVLPLFGPTALFSAERLRCRQTLEPLGERLDLPVQPMPELGEEEFADDPQAGLAALARLLHGPAPHGRADGTGGDAAGVAVVCSQGGAIPSVLMAMGVRYDGAVGRLHPPAAKGSTWALGGRPGALSADYYRDFDPDPEVT